MLGSGRKEGRIPRLFHTAKHILTELDKAEVALSQEQSVAHVCRAISITEQTYYRWNNENGGLKVNQVKRLKEFIGFVRTVRWATACTRNHHAGMHLTHVAAGATTGAGQWLPENTFINMKTKDIVLA